MSIIINTVGGAHDITYMRMTRSCMSISRVVILRQLPTGYAVVLSTSLAGLTLPAFK